MEVNYEFDIFFEKKLQTRKIIIDSIIISLEKKKERLLSELIFYSENKLLEIFRTDIQLINRVLENIEKDIIYIKKKRSQNVFF